MNVTQYTFQSPSTSQVQVGKPVPDTKKATEEKQEDSKEIETLNVSLDEAKTIEATQAKEVTPTVESDSSRLDFYA